jgi:hypothetical protein
MNPITFLTDNVQTLWTWTYGIIAGWGLTFTVLVAAVAILVIRVIELRKECEFLNSQILGIQKVFAEEIERIEGKLK